MNATGENTPTEGTFVIPEYCAAEALKCGPLHKHIVIILYPIISLLNGVLS